MAPRHRRGPLARLLRSLAWCLGGATVLSILLVASLRFLDPPASAFMLRERWLERGNAGYRQQHAWVDWDAIADPVKIAVLAAEDQKFPAHRGFDLDSIGQALEGRWEGRTSRGASTLSQQLVKNLFLWPGQSWVRKGLEAWGTVWLEVCLDKARILELYLNVAEFGPGIYGVGAASERYFGKPAGRLNAAEAALLAAVLPNPRTLRIERPSAYVRDRQQWILGQMRTLGPATLTRLEAPPRP